MARVYIELQRLQTWIFLAPRLRAMIGGNTLLGEVLRLRLRALAQENTSWELGPGVNGFPSSDPMDPLAKYDDPSSDAHLGILSRDGGHFEAEFSTGAENFAAAAARLLRSELPGIRFLIKVDDRPLLPVSAGISTELPVLEPCEWTGRGLASVPVHQGEDEIAWVTLDVKRRHEAAKRSEGGNAQDIASLLLAETGLKNMQRAETFKDLAGRGYLAFIHADGNGVGKAAKSSGPVEESEDAARASFFHHNRVLLRCALQRALNRLNAVDGTAPLQLLMLGGDDLLAVSRAEVALPFVRDLSDELTKLQEDGKHSFNLTLGFGVVFARPTIPIQRLHDVAERLAASAKRRFRSIEPGSPRSVVDWAVYTTSWLDNPEAVRRRDWTCAASPTRVLSRRPLDVLGQGLDSLEGLLTAAQKLKAEGAPRSQLRFLVEQLPRGRILSDLAFEELSSKTADAFRSCGVKGVWQDVDSGWAVTPLLDLIEIYEIGNLGRAGTVRKSAGRIQSGREMTGAGR